MVPPAVGPKEEIRRGCMVSDIMNLAIMQDAVQMAGCDLLALEADGNSLDRIVDFTMWPSAMIFGFPAWSWGINFRTQATLYRKQEE
jgi:hypothetical protein